MQQRSPFIRRITPQPAPCECVTLRPGEHPSGPACKAAPRPVTVQGIGPAKLSPPFATAAVKPADEAFVATKRAERIAKQRERIVELCIELLAAIADWRTARDRAYRAALHGRLTPQLRLEEHEANARCEELEAQSAAAERVLEIMERGK